MPTRHAPSAALIDALRAYRAMPGARNRCTYSEGKAADAAFEALKAAARDEGFTVLQVGAALDRM